jgi:hypothetical protein
MTLPIIDSMLRGDLRRQILSTLKTEKEISLLWRNLMKATQGEQRLMAIEQALIAAVETSGLVKVSADYNDDREVRQGAEEARKHGMNFGADDYTRVDEKLSLEGVFNPTTKTTPTDKFLHLLVKVECRRTLESLLLLVKSVHDDAVVRTYIRKLFSVIISLCKDANDLYIKESLSQLYFEVYHTFRNVLEKGDLQSYETDFENFVFDWKGEFPEQDVLVKYKEMVEVFAPSRNHGSDAISPKTTEQANNVIVKPKDKFDKFLVAANAFSFSEMPKIKELGTPLKIRQLVECLLQEKETIADTFGHTAAMLEFLGFYKWIADNHVSGYRLNQYDAWCSKNIMGKSSGTAFKHYRLSVIVSSTDTGNESYKYLGWKYKDSVKEEYQRILQG